MGTNILGILNISVKKHCFLGSIQNICHLLVSQRGIEWNVKSHIRDFGGSNELWKFIAPNLTLVPSLQAQACKGSNKGSNFKEGDNLNNYLLAHPKSQMGNKLFFACVVV